MVEKKIKEEVLPPEEKTKKGKNFTANKKNLFILKFAVFALIALNIVILSAVFWNRYLEPKFGFDFVSSGQPVAEALSLAPVVNDTPPSTFQGEPEPAQQVETNTHHRSKNEHESLLKEIVDAIQGQVTNAPPSELSQLQDKVQQIKDSLLVVQALQIITLAESRVVTLPELEQFLSHNPELQLSELRNILSQNKIASLSTDQELEDQVIAAQDSQAEPPKNEKFLAKVKSWFQTLITIEKSGENKATVISPHFIEAVQAHNVPLAIEHYQILPEDLKTKLAPLYEQFLLRDALHKAQRELILKNIS